MVLKRMEPVMGGREGLTVGWVVEKIEKARDDKERQCIESWDTKSATNVKYFTNISSVKYFTQICLGWFH